jgi:hypothetical protein
MKAEALNQSVTVFPGTVARAVSELRRRLQEDYEQVYPGLSEIIRIVLDEEEANAWKLTSFPHLLLPDLVGAHIATLGLDPVDTRRDDIAVPAMNRQLILAAAC